MDSLCSQRFFPVLYYLSSVFRSKKPCSSSKRSTNIYIVRLISKKNRVYTNHKFEVWRREHAHTFISVRRFRETRKNHLLRSSSKDNKRRDHGNSVFLCTLDFISHNISFPSLFFFSLWKTEELWSNHLVVLIRLPRGIIPMHDSQISRKFY